MAGLDNHHHGEDELIWPLLRQRAITDAEIVSRMEHQHDTRSLRRCIK